MNKNKYVKKLCTGYAAIWAASIAWVLCAGMIPNTIDNIILPLCAAAILFYPAYAVGLICNQMTEMGRWLIGSALGVISAGIFIAWYFINSPIGIEIVSFCANGLIASALISIGTISAACFVGKYRYA